MENGPIRLTVADLRAKRHELELQCRRKTGLAAMREYARIFLAQNDLTEIEIIEADL
jgi:hypothetical protein